MPHMASNRGTIPAGTRDEVDEEAGELANDSGDIRIVRLLLGQLFQGKHDLPNPMQDAMWAHAAWMGVGHEATARVITKMAEAAMAAK